MSDGGEDGQFGARRGRSVAIVAAALATGKTVKQAAKAGRVGERTVYKWLRKPAFVAKVDALREQAIGQAVGLLATDMAKAERTLAALLRSKDERVRLRAGVAVLALGVRVREATEFARRLAALEQRNAVGAAEGTGAGGGGPAAGPAVRGDAGRDPAGPGGGADAGGAGP